MHITDKQRKRKYFLQQFKQIVPRNAAVEMIAANKNDQKHQERV